MLVSITPLHSFCTSNVSTCMNTVSVKKTSNIQANDKIRNPCGFYSRFYVIVMSSCTSQVGVYCRLLNLSMDSNTVLGFPDTSEDYKSLVSKYRTPHTREMLSRLSIDQSMIGCQWLEI